VHVVPLLFAAAWIVIWVVADHCSCPTSMCQWQS
jgi:hypothetical protein